MNDKVKILVVEDEFILATDLAETLETEGYEVVGVVDNGAEALELFKENEIDLVLCDININGDWDGIQTVAQLLLVRAVPVIYLTALADKATIERAKLTHPAAYIPKPYHLTNLRMAIEMAINNFAFRVVASNLKVDKNQPLDASAKDAILQINDDIFVKQNYQFVKFKLNEILYLEADNIYTTIVTPLKKYVIRQTIGNVLERLPLKQLVRIHRSFVVNVSKIESFNEHEVIIEGRELPLSRTFKDEFMKQFMFR
jgi:two-component system, response regulator PdtaR